MVLPYSKETFCVPKNLDIIATMNTADRSIGNVDYALRRRFTWFEFLADTKILECWLKKHSKKSNKLVFGKEPTLVTTLMENVNEKITNSEIGEDCTIGQSYFMEENIDKKKIQKNIFFASYLARFFPKNLETENLSH